MSSSTQSSAIFVTDTPKQVSVVWTSNFILLEISSTLKGSQIRGLSGYISKARFVSLMI